MQPPFLGEGLEAGGLAGCVRVSFDGVALTPDYEILLLQEDQVIVYSLSWNIDRRCFDIGIDVGLTSDSLSVGHSVRQVSLTLLVELSAHHVRSHRVGNHRTSIVRASQRSLLSSRQITTIVTARCCQNEALITVECRIHTMIACIQGTLHRYLSLRILRFLRFLLNPFLVLRN